MRPRIRAGVSGEAPLTLSHTHRRPRRQAVSRRIEEIPASGIRRFFDVIASMSDVISLGVGEPDFVTPGHISGAAVEAIERGETHYTSNFGLIELRRAVSDHLD